MLDILWTPKCFNSLWPTDAIWWHRSLSSLARVNAHCLKAQSLTELMLTYHQCDSLALTLGQCYGKCLRYSYKEWCYMPKCPWLPRLIYVHRVETVSQSRPQNCLGIYVCAEEGEHEKVWPCSSLGNHGSLVVMCWLCISCNWSIFGDPCWNGWWVMVQTRSKWDKFGFLSWIWPWRSRSIFHKTIEILTTVFYISDSNLAILA